MILEGIDVSSYQGDVDWQQVRYAGKRFGACKATEGTNVLDSTFPRDWSGIHKAGLPRLAYHFFYDWLDPIAQVQTFHSYVRNNGRFHYGDGIALDVEEYGIKEPATTIERLVEAVERCWRDIDKPVGIYTNYDTWVNVLGNPTHPVLAKCFLWQSAYSPYVDRIPNWPSGLSMWQYSDTGHCPGVSGQCDLSRFYGTSKQLHELLTVVPS